ACFALAGDNRYHSVYGGVRFRLTPCVHACPAGIEIPSYIPHLEEGDMAAAACRLVAHNPLPAITGRVCPHFCESECNRAQVDEAVSVRALERSIGDFLLDHWEEIGLTPAPPTDKRVAVVGAGPAGLSAAYYLRMQGHDVVVIDRFDRPGGMLNHAIPAYRLPDGVVDGQVEILRGLGISFRLGVDLGDDVSLQELRDEYDAIFLATGTWEEKQLGIGEGPEVISGLEYLRRVRAGDGRGTADGRGAGAQERTAGHTLVIGGGNVAIDAAITAKRLGARRVTLACLESFDEMPAIRAEIDAAVEEGIEIMPSCGPARMLRADGGAAGMELVACTSVFDATGAFAPTYDLDNRTMVEADRIVVAIGQQPDLSALRTELPEQAFERGLLKVDPATQETSVAGLFAGGDLTSGPGFVVFAIAAGRRAAASIGRYLGVDDGTGAFGGDDFGLSGEAPVTGEAAVTGKAAVTAQKVEEFCAASFGGGVARAVVPVRSADTRTMDTEDAAGLTPEQVWAESSRCMKCACVSVNSSDLAPVLIALGASIKTTKRVVEAKHFFAVDVGTSTVLDRDELVTEIELPKPVPGSRSGFIKFALRKSIDFPVVSCAVTIAGTAGSIDSASICLNAVYGRPYIAAGAEHFLVGKRIDAEIASAAGEIAVEEGASQSGNSYKLQIARALVERCILACSTHDT
ncbi:MAG: FAD-dependent oxidoreductase, partial [bacterium]